VRLSGGQSAAACTPYASGMCMLLGFERYVHAYPRAIAGCCKPNPYVQMWLLLLTGCCSGDMRYRFHAFECNLRCIQPLLAGCNNRPNLHIWAVRVAVAHCAV
jgi:hypothetical protein